MLITSACETVFVKPLQYTQNSVATAHKPVKVAAQILNLPNLYRLFSAKNSPIFFHTVILTLPYVPTNGTIEPKFTVLTTRHLLVVVALSLRQKSPPLCKTCKVIKIGNKLRSVSKPQGCIFNQQNEKRHFIGYVLRHLLGCKDLFFCTWSSSRWFLKTNDTTSHQHSHLSTFLSLLENKPPVIPNASLWRQVWFMPTCCPGRFSGKIFHASSGCHHPTPSGPHPSDGTETGSIHLFPCFLKNDSQRSFLRKTNG